MSVLGAVIVPHPPIILPEIGKGEEKKINKTIEAYRKVARMVADWNPDTVVITSPHTVLYADYFHISPGKKAGGDFLSFGAPNVKITADYDQPFVEELMKRARKAHLPAGTFGEQEPELDHATMIPLRFLQEAGVSCKVIRIGLSGLSALTHYRLGKCISETAEALQRKIVFVASGDLSHKLLESGPYGFSEDGPQFDHQVTEAMKTGDFLKFLEFSESFCESAAECGLRSFQIMAGGLDGLSVSPELLSYEGTFGVGYAVASFSVTGKDDSRHFDRFYEQQENQRMTQKRQQEDPYVHLARKSLETFVETGKRLSLQNFFPQLPEELRKKRAGAFVSIHQEGRLRGCIGTIEPAFSCLAEEIIHNAVSAGTADPRFSPVKKEELPSLEYSVDVLEKPEKISSPEELDVKKYGVIVSAGERRGLLLPNLEGVTSVKEQIEIARRKAGIGKFESYSLERFKVVRHF